MKTTPRSILAGGIALLLVTSSALAQHRSFITREAGPYFRFDMGAAVPQDGHITEFTGFGSGGEVRYDVGVGMDLAAGFAFNPWVATELQFGWTVNEIDSIEGFRLDDTVLMNTPILANVVLQYPLARGRVVPYLGGGVGGVGTIFDTEWLSRSGPEGTVSLYGSEGDFVFAYQGFAGVRFNFNNRLYLGVGYKYFAADGSSYRYPSYYYGEPDLRIGFSAQQVHMATVSLVLKF